MTGLRLIGFPITASLALAPALSQQAPVDNPAVATPLVAAGSAPSTFAADNIAPPASGKGQVIFFRKGGFAGSAISCAVHENGAKLTSLPPGHFAVLDVDPGVHSYTVQSEATDTMRLDVQAGQIYYASCTISMGIMAGHPNLTPSDHTTFFAMGTKLKPVAPPKS
jgi:hypothetical protein